MSGLHTGGRIAAAAAITGMAWLGPQALGVASADSSGSPDAGSSSSPARGGQHGSRTPSASEPTAPVVRSASSTRAPAAASAVATVAPPHSISPLPENPPAVETAPVVRAATPQPRSSAPAVAVVSPTPAAAVPVAAVTAHPAAVTSGLAAAAVASGPPTSAPTTTTPYSPPKLTLPTLRTVVDAVTPRVAAFIDRVNHWVSTLPTSPVTDFVAGALLKLRNELQPPVLVGGNRISSTFTPPVRVEIRNETNAPFDISAYYDGYSKNELVYITSIFPGETWTSTAGNDFADHNLVISEFDGSRPVMRIVADSRIFYDFVDVWYPVPNGGKNNRWLVEPSVNQSASLSIGGTSGPKVWVWRGEDVPSGSWLTYDSTNFVVAVWQLPNVGRYDVSNDANYGGNKNLYSCTIVYCGPWPGQD